MTEPARLKILGDTLGRYQLLAPIGQGGMAEVFLGRLRGAAGFAKLVVIKRMHSHLSHDKRFIELFINEGRVVANLSHPNICQVHELGEEEGCLFLAMEYLSGVSLEELLRVLPRGTAYELPLVAGLLGQACDGLHYAHQLRDRMGKPTPVVHRDVSPQNLFVTTDGVCKVLDFGVAKISTADRFSQSGMIKGKLPYMAPEQIQGQRVDARTDVFAMGVVLWETLTGTRLFSRPSDYLIWKAITEDPIPRLSQLRPDLPAEVDEVVRRALARDPEQRYQTILALGQDLRRVARPAPYDATTIAEAVRTLCAERLAENTTIVDSALHHLDLPTAERAAVTEAEDPGAAETLHSGLMPSIMLREESVQKAPPRRPRRIWPVVLLGAVAVAAAIAAIAVTLLRTAPAPVAARQAAATT
ncbi:MAG TPA: serine/threonine-protein kinase, partial [Kofleriaceae bacterium]|nr:serine/threonine-protein kinase [Kofleriaceae bacterium]